MAYTFTPKKPILVKAEGGKTAGQLLAELTELGYDRDASWRFAKAARSWCDRDSAEWNAWTGVVQKTAPPG